MNKFRISLLLLLSCGILVSMAKPKTVKIHIIETSDVHGCFFPYNYTTLKPQDGSMR